jgi:hypothetical protein
MTVAKYINSEALKVYQSSFELASLNTTSLKDRIHLVSLKTFITIKALFIDCLTLVFNAKHKLFSCSKEDTACSYRITSLVLNHLFNPSSLVISSSKKHKDLKIITRDFISQEKNKASSVIFSEQELQKATSAILIDFPAFTINGPNLLEKLAKRGNSFQNNQNYYDLKISQQTLLDLIRTPIALKQKNERVHELGILRPKLSLDSQIRELKTRILQSIGQTPDTIKTTELAINCIHQEQIKPLLFYAQSLLPSHLHLQAKKTGRLFSIVINQNNTMTIQEKIVMTLLEEGAKKKPEDIAPELRELDKEIELSYSFDISEKGHIENTSYKLAFTAS